MIRLSVFRLLLLTILPPVAHSIGLGQDGLPLERPALLYPEYVYMVIDVWRDALDTTEELQELDTKIRETELDRLSEDQREDLEAKVENLEQDLTLKVIDELEPYSPFPRHVAELGDNKGVVRATGVALSRIKQKLQRLKAELIYQKGMFSMSQRHAQTPLRKPNRRNAWNNVLKLSSMWGRKKRAAELDEADFEDEEEDAEFGIDDEDN